MAGKKPQKVEDTQYLPPLDQDVLPTDTEQPKSEQPLFVEISKADSALYEPYQLRPYNPDELYQRKGSYLIFDEMRQDEQIHALLTLKKMMIIDTEWLIECDDENVKDFLTWNLDHGMTGRFSSKLFEILTALDFGFSISEKIWDFCEEEDWAGKIYLKNIKTRAPHTFLLFQDQFGNLTNIQQNTAAGYIDHKEDEFDKFIHYVYRGEFDNPFGQSDLNLGVYKAWWSKCAIQKFWNIYLERHGMPTTVGTYPQSLTREKDNLKKVIDKIQSSTGIVVPEGVKIELLEAAAGGSKSQFNIALDYYNTMIARALLIPDLLGYSGRETGGGSYALGKEHFGIFWSVIQQTRRDIELAVNRDIIKPLVLYNFGKGINATFRYREINDAIREKNLQAFIEAVNTGKFDVDFEKANWYMEQIDAPLYDEKEWQEKEDMKNAITDQLVQGNDAPTEDQKAGDKEVANNGQADGAKLEDAGDTKPADDKPGDSGKQKEKPDDKQYQLKQYKRELTPYEKKVDFAKIDGEMDAIEKEYRQQVADVIGKMVNGIIDDIRKKKIIEKKRFEQINKLKLRHQTEFQEIVLHMMEEAIRDGYITAEKGTRKYADTPGLNYDDIVAWMNEHSFYVTNTESEFILNQVKPILMDGIKTGKTVDEMAAEIQTKMSDTYGMELTDNRVETIVRTTTASAYNEGRAQQFEEMADYIVAYQFSAILDHRTCEICDALDETYIDPDDVGSYQPPIHFNCRCLLVPIFVDEEWSGDFDAPGVTRSGGFIDAIHDEAESFQKNYNWGKIIPKNTIKDLERFSILKSSTVDDIKDDEYDPEDGLIDVNDNGAMDALPN